MRCCEMIATIKLINTSTLTYVIMCVCVCGENTQDLLSAAFPISTSLQSLGLSIQASASMS